MYKGLIYLIVVISLQGSVSVFGQTSDLTSQVEALCNEANQLYRTDTKGALKVCDEAISLCKNAGDSSLLIKPMTSKTLVYFQTGQVKLALDQLDEMIIIGTALNDDHILSNVYRRLGQIHQFTSEPDKALKSYHESIKHYRKYGDYDGTPTIYADIGDIYSTIGDYEKAKENYLKALDLAPHWKSEKLTNGIKTQLAKCYLKLEDLDSAAVLSEQAFISNEKNDIDPNYENPKLVLAEISIKKGKFKDALAQLTELLDRAQKRSDDRQIAFLSKRVGEVYYKLRQFDKAKGYFESAYLINKDLKDTDQAEGAMALAVVFEQMGQYAEACKYYKIQIENYSEFLNEESQNQINQWETKFKTQEIELHNLQLKKDNEDAEKEQAIAEAKIQIQNLTIGAIVGGAILLIGLILLIVNRNKMRAQNELMLSEQKLLRSQMNPHFIFNSLTAIQGFVYKNESKVAGEYLSEFAALMRLILENSKVDYIPMEKELMTLTKYLDLQRARFDNNFEFSIELSENLDVDSILIPPMFAQPFIENAIEHGLAHVDKDGEIKIKMTLLKERIRLVVEDNGIGREASEAINIIERKEHQSFALQIVKDRLMILSKDQPHDIHLSIEDIENSDGKVAGTRVKIELPIKEIY